MTFITDPTSPEARALLIEPVIAFDIESDARPWHWKKTHKRGVSYCADMTEIAFYAGPHLPTLVLSASPRPAQFVYEAVSRGEDGLPVFEDRAVEMEAFEFSPEQIAFIAEMFNREDPVTFVAHNLVFDARQVFGKFGFEIRDNFTLWDTRSIHTLHSGWMPDGWNDEDEEETDEDDFDENDEEVVYRQGEDKTSLMAVYERMVGRLDPSRKAFLNFMKGERANFPIINFEKFFSLPDVIAYCLGAELIGRSDNEQLATYLIYQYAEKTFYPTKTSVDADVFHQALNLLLDQPTLIEIDDTQGQSKNEMRKRWKAALESLQPYLERVGRRLMEHYVTFDVTAAYEIWEIQQTPPAKYPKYPKLLQEDLDYIKWCAEVAARGVLVDRAYAKQKLTELHQEYLVELEKMGFTAADWERVKKTDFAVQYIFWNNEIDALYKDGKNYAKNVKEHIARLEAAGEKPRTEPPTHEIIDAFQFDILTAKGKQAFARGWKIKTEHFSFGKKACAVWASDIYPDKPLVKSIARLKKLQGGITFLEMILRETECDGRAHTLLGRFAVTGRNTSVSPNLHNIHFDADDPVTDMAGIFIADSEHCFIEADYSNAENFTATMYSGDPNLALACVSADFHASRAAMFFPEEWKNGDKAVRKTLRKNSKTWTFGNSYGMGVKKFAATLRISEEDARVKFKERDEQMYPYLAQAKEDAKAFAGERGFINTWSGRRMKIGKKWNKESGRLEYKGYTGWNSMNQGGVADIVVFAINRVRKYLRDKNYKTHIATQVHDSLIIAVALDEYPFVVQEIIEIMSSVLDGEIREKWSTPEEPVYWNDSTNPPVRWLTELDNMGNAKKWGRVGGQSYPFPLDEYVNRWGVHRMTEAELAEGKAPTWINQWGYGEKALAREMGVESFEPDPGQPAASRQAHAVIPTTTDFNWAGFQMAFREAMAVIGPMQYNERVFDFPEAMAVRAELLKRGQDSGLREVMNKFDKLAEQMERYNEWKTGQVLLN